MRKLLFVVILFFTGNAFATWLVPDYRQDDPEWYDDLLGDCPLSVTSLGEEGCAVTCTASLFRCHNILIDGETAYPNNLNWKLQEEGGYGFWGCGNWDDDTCLKWYNCHCILLFSKAAEISNGIATFIDGKPKAIGNIDTYLLSGPVIVHLKRPNLDHFVLATGKNTDGSYSVMDPLDLHANYTLTDADTLRVFTFTNQPVIFNDVPNDYWTEKEGGYIAELVARGIAQGQNGYFYPENYVTRGELCTMLVRARGLPWRSSYANNNPFTDLPSSHSHYQSVLICYNLGFVQGVGNRFYPDTAISRCDAAKIVVKGFELISDSALQQMVANGGAINKNHWLDYTYGQNNYCYASYLFITPNADKKFIMTGTLADRNFWPNTALKRSEIAKIICLALRAE